MGAVMGRGVGGSRVLFQGPSSALARGVDPQSVPTQPPDECLSAAGLAPVSHLISTCQLLDQHL